jgi:hypothetical protein
MIQHPSLAALVAEQNRRIAESMRIPEERLRRADLEAEIKRQFDSDVLNAIYGHHLPGGVVPHGRVEIDLDPKDYREVLQVDRA